jgi:hypothetical protein
MRPGEVLRPVHPHSVGGEGLPGAHPRPGWIGRGVVAGCQRQAGPSATPGEWAIAPRACPAPRRSSRTGPASVRGRRGAARNPTPGLPAARRRWACARRRCPRTDRCPPAPARCGKPAAGRDGDGRSPAALVRDRTAGLGSSSRPTGNREASTVTAGCLPCAEGIRTNTGPGARCAVRGVRDGGRGDGAGGRPRTMLRTAGRRGDGAIDGPTGPALLPGWRRPRTLASLIRRTARPPAR